MITLTSQKLVVTVNPDIGGRVSSLVWGDTQILVTSATSPLDWGLYPMVPYAGRVKNGELSFEGQIFSLPVTAHPHAIHGTVSTKLWHIHSQSDDSVQMSTDLAPDWPFRGEVQHSISLTDHVIRFELTVLAHERMPVQVGWHPWFSKPQRVSAPFGSMLERDTTGITTLQRVRPQDPPVDDCFVEPVKWPQLQVENTHIEVVSNCTHWVRYDAPWGDVCIEPQSGPPNGVNSEPIVLGVNETFTRWMELRISCA